MPKAALTGVSLQLDIFLRQVSRQCDVLFTSSTLASHLLPCHSFFVWFSVVPLLPYMQASLGLSNSDLWISNIFSKTGENRHLRRMI